MASVYIAGAYAQPMQELLNRCATSDRDSIKFQQNPALLQNRQEGEKLISSYLDMSSRASLRTGAISEVIIPVVVHVVHQSTNINATSRAEETNISEAQIQSQIDILNEDYGNRSGITTFYSGTHGVDTKIRFKLVNIVRIYSAVKEFDPISDAAKLAAIAPPRSTERFLNIWVCKLSGNYLGSAQFPVVTKITQGTLGLEQPSAEDSPDTDGVMIDYRYFGRNARPITSALYNLGRTTTHEVGHWLGLIHIWGDSVCGDDYCDDTPAASGSNQVTDLNCLPVYSTCSGIRTRNMTDNYMDYSPDVCMGLFTNDQTERIHAVLNLSPRRARLVANSRRSENRLTVDILSSPISDLLRTDIYSPDYADYTMDIFNSSGTLIKKNIKNQSNIDMSNVAAGIYILRVQTEVETVTKRFLIL